MTRDTPDANPALGGAPLSRKGWAARAGLLRRLCAGLLALSTVPVAAQTERPASTSRADVASRRAPAAARPNQPVPAVLEGDWTAAVQCGEQAHWLRWSLLNDGSATLRVEGEVPASGRFGNAAQGWPTEGWEAAYDAGGERLALRHRRGGTAPELLAVVAPQGWAGRLVGRNWGRCSTLVALRAPAADSLRARHAAVSTRVEPRPPAGMLGGLVRRLTRRDRCDGDTLRWMDAYLARLAAQPAPLTAAASRRLVDDMFADAVFAPAFGKPLTDMDVTEARQLWQVLMGSPACGAAQAQARLAAAPVQALAKPLMDHADHNRGQVVLALAAHPVFDQWAATQLQRMDAWKATAPDAIALPEIDGALAALAAFGDDTREAARIAAALPALQQLRAQVALAVDVRSVMELAATTPADLAALGRLAAEAQRFKPGVEPGESARLAALQRVDAMLVPATTAWAAQRTGGIGWQQLAGWRTDHAALLFLATPARAEQAQAVVSARQDELEAMLVGNWRQTHASQIAAHAPGLPALAAGVALEKQLRDQVGPLAARPQVQALVAERAVRRLQDLEAALPELTRRLAGAPHQSALEALRGEYWLPADEASRPGRALLDAMAARQAQVAPFVGLPGADYLNALYGADVQRLQALDQAFRAPYARMMAPAVDHMAPIINLVGKAAGMRLDYKTTVTKAINNVSLIAPMFATYLVEYEGRLGPCLERDAVTFKRTTTSETVYRDGWGNFKYSVQHPDRVETFKVNRRFAKVFEQIGLAGQGSVLGELIDRGLRNKGQLGLTDITAGTRAMMQRFDREGCASPLMARMEASMLEQFSAYAKGQDDALGTLLEGRR